MPQGGFLKGSIILNLKYIFFGGCLVELMAGIDHSYPVSGDYGSDTLTYSGDDAGCTVSGPARVVGRCCHLRGIDMDVALSGQKSPLGSAAHRGYNGADYYLTGNWLRHGDFNKFCQVDSGKNDCFIGFHILFIEQIAQRSFLVNRFCYITHYRNQSAF